MNVLSSPGRARVLCRVAAALIVASLALAAGGGTALAATADDGTSWRPVASERLIKLPASYLKKAVENDFRGSGLALAIRDAESLIGLKSETLADLQSAIDQTDGELEVELRHQFLAEKREYLTLVARHQELRRKQLTTEIRLYERLIGKIGREQAAMTPQKQALIEKQEQARQRLDRSLSKVDMALFSAPMYGESKYAKDYAKNVMAIERLVQAINAHPMSDDSKLTGGPMNKKSYLRQLVSEAEADLAIVDQEETILGYMAKLIALDALALSEVVADGDGTVEEADEEPADLASAVDFFIAP